VEWQHTEFPNRRGGAFVGEFAITARLNFSVALIHTWRIMQSNNKQEGLCRQLKFKFPHSRSHIFLTDFYVVFEWQFLCCEHALLHLY
jgi:hypothetical protein